MGTQYTTLNDLESRLDGAVERGEITEYEAQQEMYEACAIEAQRLSRMYFDTYGDPSEIF